MNQHLILTLMGLKDRCHSNLISSFLPWILHIFLSLKNMRLMRSSQMHNLLKLMNHDIENVG